MPEAGFRLGDYLAASLSLRPAAGQDLLPGELAGYLHSVNRANFGHVFML